MTSEGEIAYSVLFRAGVFHGVCKTVQCELFAQDFVPTSNVSQLRYLIIFSLLVVIYY